MWPSIESEFETPVLNSLLKWEMESFLKTFKLSLLRCLVYKWPHTYLYPILLHIQGLKHHSPDPLSLGRDVNYRWPLKKSEKVIFSWEKDVLPPVILSFKKCHFDPKGSLEEKWLMTLNNDPTHSAPSYSWGQSYKIVFLQRLDFSYIICWCVASMLTVLQLKPLYVIT